MPDLRHRAARVIATTSESCLITLLMLPAVAAHTIINLPWRAYQALIRRRMAKVGPCDCGWCEPAVHIHYPDK